VQKKRPCSECRRWFLPDARVGDRQRTCGAAACQRARHERSDRAWRARNPDYDRDRRWRERLAAAKADARRAPPGACVRAAAPEAGVPWEMVQDEIGVEGRVILAGVVGVLGRHVQDEMRRQAIEIVGEFGGHGRDPPQAEMEVPV